MFIFDTIKDSERIEEVVRTIYKLSPTEAKVASKLVYNPYQLTYVHPWASLIILPGLI